MIYPEYKDKSSGVLSSIWNKGVALFTRSGTNHPRIDSSKMRKQCLRIHLEPFKRKMLEGDFMAKFDIQRAVEPFVDLYECCAYQYYGTAGPDVHDWDMAIQLSNVG